jgi:glutamyl-tRNA reductase
MKFIAYGLNHLTAPISVREKFALVPEAVRNFLKELKPLSHEAVFLSTCNRVEFYAVCEKDGELLERIRRGLNQYHPLLPSEVKKYFYFYEGIEAFRHLFRVSSSLDSMVLGEAQILGQVKEAFRESAEAGMAGSVMTGIFNRAFAAAKKVRNHTEIARMPVSVSSVAVALARQIFTSLKEKKVLLLGAGEMSELTAKYLVNAGASDFFVANRTLEKRKTLAHQLKGVPLTLEDAIDKMGFADIVLTSLQVDRPLVSRQKVEKALKVRRGRPLFIIDIGVPRNVEPEAGQLEQVYLYNIDDLLSVAQANQEERKNAIASADQILSDEIGELFSWLNNLELVPTIVRLKERFEKIRQKEWKDFSRKVQTLPEKERESIERLTRDLAGHLLHDPLVTLKNLPNEKERFEYAKMLNDLFHLWKEPEE